MEFCPKCEALLFPRKDNGKVILVCKKCGFEGEAEGETEYKLVVKIPHSDSEKIAIVEGSARKKISEEEREAFEDYYRGIEEDEETETDSEM